jgi:acylphosphatase
MKRVHILVKGLVQGVYFRHYTYETAADLGLTGWVRNLPDGRVEVLCEGTQQGINKLIEWCKIGPPGGHVKGVDITWEDYTGEFSFFEIRH